MLEGPLCWDIGDADLQHLLIGRYTAGGIRMESTSCYNTTHIAQSLAPLRMTYAVCILLFSSSKSSRHCDLFPQRRKSAGW